MHKSVMIGIVLGALHAASLSAQESHRRQGFWIGFGLGGGVNLSKGLDDKQLWGGNGYIRLGGTTKRNLLLGGEVIGWGRDYHDITLSRGNVHFVALYYPNVQGGFYLKGGVGVAEIARERTQGSTQTRTTKGGFGTGVGLGYELQIGRNLYLVPATDILLQVFERQTDPVLGRVPGSNTLLLFTLGLTWH
ncbi:MAG TPA: outer membrane beta-barrel protein [Gemmatimonadales bacterium]|jgi:hypothetical protein